MGSRVQSKNLKENASVNESQSHMVLICQGNWDWEEQNRKTTFA